jgi:hypothetical protein
MGEYIHYDESRFKSALNIAPLFNLINKFFHEVFVTKTPIGPAEDSHDSLSLHEEGTSGTSLRWFLVFSSKYTKNIKSIIV